MTKNQRGFTLLEVLMSVALVVLGMLGLLNMLASSTSGASIASQLTQGQFRAANLIEAIRNAPVPALQCLTTLQPAQWSQCEQVCLAAYQQQGAPAASAQSCIFTISSMALLTGPKAGSAQVTNQTVDRSGQQYTVMFTGAQPQGPQSSFVQQRSFNNRVFDAQVTVGWNGNGTNANPNHFVTLRTGVFQ